MFFELKDRVASLVNQQRQICNNFLIEAKKKIAEGNDDAKKAVGSGTVPGTQRIT